MLRFFKSVSNFAKSKEIIVRNLFTQEPIETYRSCSNEQITKMLQDTKTHRKTWSKLPKPQRQQIITKFYSNITTEESINKMSNLLSQCTGKQLEQCFSQVRVSLKILKYHINYPYTKIRYFQKQLNLSGSNRDYYKFQPFDSLLSVYDHRHPILSSFTYLGLALRSNNSLIMRPSNIVLPVVKIIQNLWHQTSKIPLITTLIDPETDPKQQNSPVNNILKETEGFVSFVGRIKDGFDFHYYMSVVNQVFRENEFLLTSSDSAYVMKDLTHQNLIKTAKIVARGCFSNCGHSFNSIKRVFVDREVQSKFMQLLVEQSKKYTIDSKAVNGVNQGLLAPFLIKKQHDEALSKLHSLKEQHKNEFKHIIGGQSISVTSKNNHQIHYITPAIFQVTSSFPNFNYQNQQYMLPICFVSYVDSISDCVQQINSSIFGITASLFTSNNKIEVIEEIGKRLDVGTINVNTWEVTDGIAYSGRKRSGKGFSLSPSSFNNIVRTKSVSYS